MERVGQIASENKIQLLLFDLREADYRNYYVETIKHTEDGPALGIKKTFRVAFLGAKEEPMLRYIENVTVNRGYQSKIFTEELRPSPGYEAPSERMHADVRKRHVRRISGERGR